MPLFKRNVTFSCIVSKRTAMIAKICKELLQQKQISSPDVIYSRRLIEASTITFVSL